MKDLIFEHIGNFRSVVPNTVDVTLTVDQIVTKLSKLSPMERDAICLQLDPNLEDTSCATFEGGSFFYD